MQSKFMDLYAEIVCLLSAVLLTFTRLGWLWRQFDICSHILDCKIPVFTQHKPSRRNQQFKLTLTIIMSPHSRRCDEKCTHQGGVIDSYAPIWVKLIYKTTVWCYYMPMSEHLIRHFDHYSIVKVNGLFI